MMNTAHLCALTTLGPRPLLVLELPHDLLALLMHGLEPDATPFRLVADVRQTLG